MKNEEILRKAIEKVGGSDGILGVMSNYVEDQIEKGTLLIGDDFTDRPKYFYIIFNHDFAKAFFGERNNLTPNIYPGWQYYLQQLVLEEDPIKYLEKFI